MGVDIYLNKKEIIALLETIHFHNVLSSTIVQKNQKIQEKNIILLSLRKKINRNSRRKGRKEKNGNN
jgi:hypothetical protein